MRMTVYQPRMLMPVGMQLGYYDAWIVVMLVMLVMTMTVLVLRFLMGMMVLMPFRQVQP